MRGYSDASTLFGLLSATRLGQLDCSLRNSPHGDMEATLLALILDVAAIGLVHVVYGLVEQLLQLHVIGYIGSRFVKAHVGDIYRSAILVT